MEKKYSQVIIIEVIQIAVSGCDAVLFKWRPVSPTYNFIHK